LKSQPRRLFWSSAK